jgi:hypothetical protein
MADASTKPTLAERRRQLVERCAEQRTGLAFELQALRPSAIIDNPVAGYVANHRKLVLGGLAAVIGLAFTRKKRLGGIVASAMSAWRVAQAALATLAHYRR